MKTHQYEQELNELGRELAESIHDQLFNSVVNLGPGVKSKINVKKRFKIWLTVKLMRAAERVDPDTYWDKIDSYNY